MGKWDLTPKDPLLRALCASVFRVFRARLDTFGMIAKLLDSRCGAVCGCGVAVLRNAR